MFLTGIVRLFLEQVIYQNNDIKRNKKVHYLLIHLRKIDKEIFFMNTIRKQIGYLYTSSVLGNLSLTGAWVAILAARGYSLVEIVLWKRSFM